MKLRTLIISIFILVSITGSIGGTYYFYLSSNEILTEQVHNHLETAAKSRTHTILLLLNNHKEKLEIAATHKDLTIEELKEIRDINKDFYEIFTLDKDGIIIASSEESNIGLDKSKDDYFVNARHKSYIKDAYYSELTKKNSFSVSTPHADGVLVARIDINILNEITLDKTGLGETGEIYLINKENYMITPSRFLGESVILKQKVNTINSKNCLAHESKEHLPGVKHISIFRDYRGIKTLGTHVYIPEINWCLLAEMDESEALCIQREELMKTSLTIVLALIILVSLIGFFISKIISKQLSRITKDVDEITKGKLDIQLKKSSIFEIQRLTDSLNRILASLKLAVLKVGIGKRELGLGEAIKAKEEAETKYKLLYETSNDAIMTIKPPTWKFTAGNPATIKMFNVKDEKEFITLGPYDLSPKYQPDKQLSSVKAKNMIMKAIKEGSNYFNWTHKRYKGDDFPATVLLSRITEGDETYLQATVRDISGMKSIETTLTTVMKYLPYGMDIVDENMNIVWMNDTFLKIFGEKAIGKKCYIIYKDNKKQCIKCPLRKPIKLGETQKLIVPGIAGGKTFDITHTGIMYKDKKAILETFKEITKGTLIEGNGKSIKKLPTKEKLKKVLRNKAQRAIQNKPKTVKKYFLKKKKR